MQYNADYKDGWMTSDFTSFLTVIQSYQDDVWVIMKGCVQWNSVYQTTRKRIKKINVSYTLEGTVLDNAEKIKYFGSTITNDLKWNTHVRKANRTWHLAVCPPDLF